jgi:D-3-phosphoglycerate dehydrogenase
MWVALVSSRSFAQVIRIGEEILVKNGFEVRYVSQEARPLDGPKLARIVARENPDVIICGAEPITAEVLMASEKLRMVMKHGVGIDNIDLNAATMQGIIVAHVPGANSEAVADLTIAMMLMLLRGIYEAVNSTKTGSWNRYIGHELGKMMVGVIGTGEIGTKVIQRLHGFGTRILAYDIVHNSDLILKYEVHYVTLEELLEMSDIVTLHVPLTERTRKMIGARELERMKESAYLINTARGEVIDEDALYAHLKAHRIAGAALDVFSREPPGASPLLQLDNVLPTPHIGAYTYEAMERMDRICAETITAVFRGEYSPNILNPTVLPKPLGK